MKKVFITAILISGLSLSILANDGDKKGGSNTTTVSSGVLKQFEYDFKDAKNITWTVNNEGQKADFELNSIKMTAYYAVAGDYIGATHHVSYNTLPAGAQQEIAGQYAGYQVKDVMELVLKQNEATLASGLPILNDATKNTSYFVDLKNEKSEVMVRVTPTAEVYFFKQVK